MKNYQQVQKLLSSARVSLERAACFKGTMCTEGMMINSKEKIEIENINTPGKTSNVNAVKYHEMKSALLMVLPEASPGLTHKEIHIKVQKHLSEDLFPEGKTSKWWSKTVQLDMEAKSILVRETTKPLRWYRL